MLFIVLQAIRDRLKADATIVAALTEWYPLATPSYFIGAKLKPTAQEFPYFAVAPMRGTRPPEAGGEFTQKISVMFGVTNELVTDGESIGLKHILELQELIYTALGAYPLCSSPRAYWKSEVQTVNDAGVQHPHYEGEFVFDVTINP